MPGKAYALTEFTATSPLSKGWEVLKENFVKVAGVLFIGFLVMSVPQEIIMNIVKGGNDQAPNWLSFIVMLVFFVWNSFVTIGIMNFLLKLVRGQEVKFDELFKYSDRLVPYLIGMLRLMLMLIPGLFLFVLPGIYVAIRFAYVPFLIADGKAEGSEAFKMSTEMTKDSMLTILLFGLVSFVAIMLGFIALVIPGLLAVASAYVGGVLVYEYQLKQVGTPVKK